MAAGCLCSVGGVGPSLVGRSADGHSAQGSALRARVETSERTAGSELVTLAATLCDWLQRNAGPHSSLSIARQTGNDARIDATENALDLLRARGSIVRWVDGPLPTRSSIAYQEALGARRDFLAEIEEVCRRRNLSLAHEDREGAFVVEPMSEDNVAWLKDASWNPGAADETK